MEKRELENSIKVSPDKLGKGLADYIKGEVESRVLGTCDNENGYITNVSDTRIVSNEIMSATSDIIFYTRSMIETMKPKEGMMVHLTVKKFIMEGTSVLLENSRMNAVIPESGMIGYRYNSKDRVYESDLDTIAIDDVILCRICKVKYYPKDELKFRCICELAD